MIICIECNKKINSGEMYHELNDKMICSNCTSAYIEKHEKTAPETIIVKGTCRTCEYSEDFNDIDQLQICFKNYDDQCHQKPIKHDDYCCWYKRKK